jgi:hypothetical protein
VPQTVRQTTNQKLFRQVNERIAELTDPLDEPDLPQSFFCECRRIGCNAMLEVPLGVYAIVRNDDDLYIVVPGHEDRDQDQTVTDHGAYLIVSSLRSDLSLAASAALRLTGSE